MARKKADPLQGSWIEAIAAASGRPPELVADFLDRHDLHAQSVIPRPVDLTVRQVALSGAKQIEEEIEPFDFAWRTSPQVSASLGPEGTPGARPA